MPRELSRRSAIRLGPSGLNEAREFSEPSIDKLYLNMELDKKPRMDREPATWAAKLIRETCIK